MKKTSTLMLVAVLLLPALATAQTPARENLKEDGFTIVFPAGFSKPQKQVQTIKSESGPIQQVTYVSKSAEGVACVLAYSELSGDILDPKAMMNSGRDSLVKSLKATIESEKELEIQGHPGMSFLYSASSPKPIFARTDLIVVGPRMYQLIFIAPTSEARDAGSAQECFSSFQVKELPAAEVTAPAAPPSAAAQTTASATPANAQPPAAPSEPGSSPQE